MFDTNETRMIGLPYGEKKYDNMLTVFILGVTISNRLSVSEHVQSVISKCVQSMHALKILRSHGMSTVMHLR